MITIQPEIEILSTESYEDMLRRIEKIGRVCYKSEERIGEGTAEKFIAGIIKRGHESVIEHGSITVKVTCEKRAVFLSDEPIISISSCCLVFEFVPHHLPISVKSISESPFSNLFHKYCLQISSNTAPI